MAWFPTNRGRGGGGALAVATRSDNSNPAVFADFAALEAYTATQDGTADANRINVGQSRNAEEVFAVGTLNVGGQVTSITAAYIRVNNNWVSVATNLVGTPGIPGPSGAGSIPPFASESDRDSFFLDASNLPVLVNSLPIEINVGGNTVENQIWTGPSNPQDYTANDNRWITARFRVSNGSIDIGPDMTISNGQNVVEVRRPDESTSELVQSVYDDTGSSRPFYQNLSPVESLNVNTTSDQTIADPFTLNYSTVGDNKTISFEVIPAEAGTLRAVFRETDASGDVIFDEFQTFTQQQVDDGNPVPFTIGNRYSLPAGTALFVSFAGIQLRGGVAGPGDALEGQTTPYFVSEIQPYVNVELLSEVDMAHPVTLRRDMPSEVDADALADASLNQNSALWITSDQQNTDSNRADAMIRANEPGLLDADGVEIPQTDVAANTIRMRSGTICRIFSGTEFRVVSSPVLESDITNAIPSSGEITRFTIQDIPNSVLAGSSFSGTQTFEYNVNHPEDVTGDLTLMQEGTVLDSAVNAFGSSVDASITTFTLSDNQEEVFQLRGETNQGVLISKFYRVRGHAPSEQLFYGLSDENNPADVDTSSFSSGHAGLDGERIATGATTAGQYFILLVPTAHDPVSIIDAVLNQNVIDIFTRTEDVRTLNAVLYTSYVLGPLTAGDSETYTLGY